MAASPVSARIEKTLSILLNGTLRGKAILAAVSGGPDSVALLYALNRLREQHPFELHCAHVQHNLRGEESLADEHLTRYLCARWGIPCTVSIVEEGAILHAAKECKVGLEAAARMYRHKLLREEARRLDHAVIMLGHTRDDLLETVLMRVLRGAGPAGLAGIRSRRGRLVRPLLEFRKAELCAYLAEHNIPYRFDSSNASDAILRGRLRNRLIPVLQKYFDGWETGIIQLAKTQTLLAKDSARRTARLYRRYVVQEHGAVHIRNFFRMPALMREELVFYAANQLKRGRTGANDLEADMPERKSGPPRRKTVRRFASGELRSVTLGDTEFHAKDCCVCGMQRKSPYWEKGFSLNITGEGSYKVEGLSFECVKCPDGSFQIIVHKT
ncbi:MAG: tRNA lysidine(34) synthetase TilS [Spirochaetaceae bacterium]|nr:tRNA lysidine(34) synthetase TilS [Spirochaetaceae bacterium]